MTSEAWWKKKCWEKEKNSCDEGEYIEERSMQVKMIVLNL